MCSCSDLTGKGSRVFSGLFLISSYNGDRLKKTRAISQSASESYSLLMLKDYVGPSLTHTHGVSVNLSHAELSYYSRAEKPQ